MPCQITRRPLLLRWTPLWVRHWLFYRLYSRRENLSAELFEASPLTFAPSVHMQLHPGDLGHKLIALTGLYELPMSRLAVDLAHEGGLHVDVGANYGYFSLLWAAARPDNRVIAFEGSPRNLAALQHNIERNNFQKQIECRPFALGRRNGEMFFQLGPEEQTGWGGFVSEAGPNCIKVPVQTLARAFENDSESVIKLLKIDTEGADTWVLQGAESLLKTQRIQHILFEEYPERMAELGIESGQAQQLLTKYGYHIRELPGHEWHAWL